MNLKLHNLTYTTQSTGVASGRRHERDLRTPIYVAAYESRSHEGFVVWMRKKQKDARWNRHARNIDDARRTETAYQR